MYKRNSFSLCEPWATIERWCGPLANTSWYNNIGMVVITIFEGQRCRYFIPLGPVETIVGWGRNEFQAQLAWRRHREELPCPDSLERHILLPGLGVLGTRLNAYFPQAITLDEVFTHLQQDPRSVLVPDSWFLVYRRVPSPNDLGWVMRKVGVVLYLQHDPWRGTPVYSEWMTFLH